MILLDTHAIVWWHRGERRARRLGRSPKGIYISPASVLELQFLVEIDRIRLRSGSAVSDLVADDRWALDDPPAAEWFERACVEAWTRDPFDRLLVAHARMRGWRLATADTMLLDRLDASTTLEL